MKQITRIAILAAAVALAPAARASSPEPLGVTHGWLVRPVISRVEATSFGIGWSTAADTVASLKLCSDADFACQYPIQTHEIPKSYARLYNLGLDNCHLIEVKDLAPDTPYWVRVDADGATATIHVNTAPAPGSTKPFKFVAIGDTQGFTVSQTLDGDDYAGTDECHAAVVSKASLAGAQFVLHLGDLTATPSTPFDVSGFTTITDRPSPQMEELSNFFAVEQPLLTYTPIVPVFGNHDWWGVAPPDTSPVTADPLNFPWMSLWLGKYREAVLPPPPTPDSPRETSVYYGHTYGNVHICVISTGPHTNGLVEGDRNGAGQGIDDAQLRWIEGDLKAASEDPKVQHIFVAMHRPVYSGLSDAKWGSEHEAFGDCPDYIDRLVPLFQQYGVKAVFSGHVHSYQHRVAGGIDYIVTGGGGGSFTKGLLGQNTAATNKLYFEWLHYVAVSPNASGSSVKFQTYRVHGPEWYDPSATTGADLVEEFWIGPGPAPGSFTASHGPLGSDSVAFSWTKSYQNANWVKLEFSYDGGPYTPFTSVSANSTSYVLDGFWPGSWRFRARAEDTRGDFSAWAYSAPLAVLGAPGSFAAVAAGQTPIHLSWTDPSGGATGFEVQRRWGIDGWYPLATLAGSARTYTDSAVYCANQFFYRVRAKDGTSVSDWSYADATTAACAPRSLSANASSSTRIDLSWVDNVYGLIGYTVQRTTTPASPASWVTVGTTAAHVMTTSDTGLAVNTAYCYRIGYNVAGNTAFSDPVWESTLPLGPSNFNAALAPKGGVLLTWTDVPGVTGYVIERAIVGLFGPGAYATIANLPAGSIVKADLLVSSGQTYSYRIRWYTSRSGIVAQYSDDSYPRGGYVRIP